METTIQWLWRITKSHFNNKINDDINISYFNNNLRIMTFNIRRDVPKDDKNNWQYRKEAIVEMIADVAPDIICMQEVMPHMAKYLKSQLSEHYDCKGLECFTGRELTKSFCILGEGLLTFYRKNRFDFIKKRKIKLFDGRKINLRRAFCIEIYDNFTYNKCNIVNTHFCHLNNSCKAKSFDKLRYLYVTKWNKNFNNTYICGDFNSEVYKNETGIGLFIRNFSYNKPDEHGTINFFSGNTGRTIDFIFGDRTVKESKIIRNSYGATKFLSDHYPVLNIY